MKINRFGMFVLGTAFFSLGLYDLTTGVTNGFGAGNMSSHEVTSNKSPIEFYLSVTFKIVIGLLSLKHALFSKSNDCYSKQS